ncbi:carboxypeptidase-like regulatory domain-containing protein [Hymenobacter sp. BT730]|uniref:carboxypeptidase-like regulatory domain-containing protein n=1 Tax=Hymenobacter sp. BT730 TaxID=3063332 RepID=UPI0026DFB56A|nr:carboxypeptidase-like regulatory domain-containing protein [Hymenobacter sp. BT730]
MLLFLGLWLTVPAAAQIRVTGSVSEAATGKVIPGASVMVQRTGRGVLANNEGDFGLNALNTDTLVFRSVGFKTQRMPLGGSGLSQLIIHIKLERDNIQLGEVRVQEGRPDRAAINRALRNVRRPSTAPASAVKRPPAPKPLFKVDSAAPTAPKPTLANPASLLYDQFSREGKERRKMEEIEARDQAEKAVQKQRVYNRNFLVNEGYEPDAKPNPAPPLP